RTAMARQASGWPTGAPKTTRPSHVAPATNAEVVLVAPAGPSHFPVHAASSGSSASSEEDASQATSSAAETRPIESFDIGRRSCNARAAGLLLIVAGAGRRGRHVAASLGPVGPSSANDWATTVVAVDRAGLLGQRNVARREGEVRQSDIE